MLRNPKNWVFLCNKEAGCKIDTDWHMGMWPARVEMPRPCGSWK
ncbi:hypothetical protein F383_11079 [Gossypium arboreum]|uniref:Uncharacterized protein n=1 Tax=Gossypium arboreum TaxID=29729 RepID=A0A0B0N7C7_GOSAR|nr:hypothetical protein F383_11079 [Gossypium arboreum]